MDFTVEGMSCAACQSTVEKAVGKVEGVEKCSVSLLTHSMSVEGSATEGDIIHAVEKAGYSAFPKGKKEKEEVEEKGEKTILMRLISSIVILLFLMYLSMGHLMWAWPLPEALSSNPMAMGILEMVLSSLILVINQKFFISGWKALLHKSPNMDTLVSLGSGASFLWSIYLLFIMTTLPHMEAHHTLHSLYFESAAMILVLITVGKLLEERSKGKTTSALKSLMALSPKEARVERDGKTITLGVEEVKRGDIFILRPGDRVPVDGTILTGRGDFDESSLTGESLPLGKEEGDTVSASTINLNGAIRCRADKVGEDTTISQIIAMVKNAGSSKAPIQRIADKVSGVFVPVVMGIALVAFFVWYVLTRDLGYSLERGISVLVISCPCALGLATPVAIMVGSGKGARNGILFKSASALEELGRVKTVVLDKTGTVTSGSYSISAIFSEDESDLLSVAYSLEKESEHPLSKAIVEECRKRRVEEKALDSFSALPGKGVEGRMDGHSLWGGKRAFAEEKCSISERALKWCQEKESDGNTVLFFGRDNVVIGLVALSDTVRSDSKEAIDSLRTMGIRTLLLTGDNTKCAQKVGREVGVDEVIAEVLPGEKAEIVLREKEKAKTAMVGDGINDSVALKSADVGVAIGSGTDVAIESADVVLVNGNLSSLVSALRLSRRTLGIIHQNLFWAFFYNALCIPLAAGVFIPIFGWRLNPMVGALAMSLSSFTVVSNALRINGIKLGNKKNNTSIKENSIMTKTMFIEGMMCGHCEARVKKTIEAIDGVISAEVSHEKGTAIVEMNSDISDTLKAAVEAQDYKVIAIK